MDHLSRLRAAWEEFRMACFAWIPTPPGLALSCLTWRWLFDRCGSVRFGTSLSFVGCRRMRLGDAVQPGRGRIITARGGELVLGDRVSASPYAHVAVGPGTVLRAANHCFSRHDVPILQQGHHPGEIVIGAMSGSGPTASSRPTYASAGVLWWARTPWSPAMWPLLHRGRCPGTPYRPPRPERMSGTVVAPGGSAWRSRRPAFFLPGRRSVPPSGSGPQGFVRLGGGARACSRILPVRRRP